MPNNTVESGAAIMSRYFLPEIENTYIYFAKAATHTRRPLNGNIRHNMKYLKIHTLEKR